MMPLLAMLLAQPIPVPAVKPPLRLKDEGVFIGNIYQLDCVGAGVSCAITGTDAGTLTVAGGGGGTVTSVSVTTANGVSGSVATATTTPAITLSLGAITPSSVASAGSVTGSNLSGTNTGDQTKTCGAGDFIQQIAAGTGSVCGTPAGGSSPLTTKGDLYTYTTVDARKGVGADGLCLKANSAEATGLEWAACSAGGGGESPFIRLLGSL